MPRKDDDLDEEDNYDNDELRDESGQGELICYLIDFLMSDYVLLACQTSNNLPVRFQSHGFVLTKNSCLLFVKVVEVINNHVII